MEKKLWDGRPYYTLGAYMKEQFGHPVRKLALDAGFSCPNRDGTIGTGGCTFCSIDGSGDFAISYHGQPLAPYLAEGNNPVIAYFQAFTNTYAPVDTLKKLYTAALTDPAVCGISIATRPDCFSEDIYALLDELRTNFPDKPIWIELGLQTVHEETAVRIHRGYPLSVFEECCHRLSELAVTGHYDLPVIVHVILGLPGEYLPDSSSPFRPMLETIGYLASLHARGIRIAGIKLQLLHVLSETQLADEMRSDSFPILTREDYFDLLCDCIELLPQDIVIHRLTGDAPRDLLIAPKWSGDKKNVLNALHHHMKIRDTWQGKQV